MSKLRPILFSTAMVQAILDGRKTQTRRVCRHQHWSHSELVDVNVNGITQKVDRNVSYPYGQPGDILWVRETWVNLNSDFAIMKPLYIYKCDGISERFTGKIKWKPSIHMPFAAARIFLRVKNVRVERLHEISDEDAVAEGIDTDLWDMAIVSRNYKTKDGWFVAWSYEHWSCENISVDVDEVYRKSFQSLWESINGSESWEANPWVWVVEFESISKEEAMQ